MNKPGGVPLSVEAMMLAAQLAKRKISVFHEALNAAMNELEGQVLLAREQRKVTLRSYLQAQQQLQLQQSQPVTGNSMDTDEVEVNKFVSSNDGVGIDRDDPILDWQNLHQPVFTREALKNSDAQPPKAPIPSAKKGKKNSYK